MSATCQTSTGFTKPSRNVPLGSITEETCDKTFNINVRGTLFTAQKALPLMRDGGSVIMTGSIASVKGFEGFSIYNASKTPFVLSRARGQSTSSPEDVKDEFVSLISMGRIGQPHEIATTALFLASDDSSFIAEIELFVDGGAAQV
jgi:NAD(P)-dependent dehydrogenase (short-subunit alcohol dehydrogenase family)